MTEMEKNTYKPGFRFSKHNLWQTFLLVAFPIHFWALIIWLQEFEATAQRTNMADAFGEGAYFLAYALFESAVIFLALMLILLLLPKSLSEEKVLAVFSTILLLSAGWFILEQVRFLEVMPEDVWFFKRAQNIRTIRSKAGMAAALALAVSMIVPPILVAKNEKLQKGIIGFVDRLSTLSSLYLGLDVLSLVVILIRNL